MAISWYFCHIHFHPSLLFVTCSSLNSWCLLLRPQNVLRIRSRILDKSWKCSNALAYYIKILYEGDKVFTVGTNWQRNWHSCHGFVINEKNYFSLAEQMMTRPQRLLSNPWMLWQNRLERLSLKGVTLVSEFGNVLFSGFSAE
jgi:hypothetical protein